MKLQVETCSFIKKDTLAQVFSFEFCQIFKSKNTCAIVCIRVSTPLKNTPPLFLAKLPLNLQTVQAAFLGNPPYILDFHETPLLNSDFSMNPKNIKVFHPSPHLNF